MIKNRLIFFLGVLSVFDLASADVPHGFRYQVNDLSIAASVPPALIYVENSQGQRVGVDPSSPLNDDGSQGNKVDSGLTEIPLSHVLQMNQSVFDGSNYSPRPDTEWNMEIYDSSPQTYVIHLKGLLVGNDEISVAGIYRGKNQPMNEVKFTISVATGQLRTVNLVFDPIQKNLSYQRVVLNGELLTDVKTACQLNEITSKYACKRLEEKAEAIQDALDHHHYEKAERLIWVFLYMPGRIPARGLQGG